MFQNSPLVVIVLVFYVIPVAIVVAISCEAIYLTVKLAVKNALSEMSDNK